MKLITTLISAILYYLLFFATPNSVDAAPTSPPLESRQSSNCRIVFFDDAAAKLPLNYEPAGAWTHLNNQGSTVKMGTLSYTGTPNGMVTIFAPFPPGTITYANVTVWSTNKNDRGRFNVYIGQTLIGTGDQYTSACQETSTQRVFYRQNVAIPGGQGYVIKNDKGAPYMAYDGFELEICE